MITIMTTSS